MLTVFFSYPHQSRSALSVPRTAHLCQLSVFSLCPHGVLRLWIYHNIDTLGWEHKSLISYCEIKYIYRSTFSTEYNTRLPIFIRAPASSPIFRAVAWPHDNMAASFSISTAICFSVSLVFVLFIWYMDLTIRIFLSFPDNRLRRGITIQYSTLSVLSGHLLSPLLAAFFLVFLVFLLSFLAFFFCSFYHLAESL